MDPIGTSSYSLNLEENSRAILELKSQDEKFQEIITSCRSLSSYQGRKLKTLLPQILAATLVASYHIVVGISLSYSAILLPQLTSPNSTDFKITNEQGSWVASIFVVATPIAAPVSGILMDCIGRLHTVKVAAIPGIIGWIIIATAYNVPMLIIGRVITGFAYALGTGPAIVYITEIARADMRGSLLSLAPTIASLGMVLTFLKGWFIGWRYIAWMSIAYTAIPCMLTFLIPESPAWLVSKGRNADALKSLDWINKYQPQPENKTESLAELQLAQLQKEHMKKLTAEAKAGDGFRGKLKGFLLPTGYKPIFILFGLFFFQQFSGIYVILFFSVQFFEAVGSTINPYMASIVLGVIRCLMSVINTYMLRTFRRRPLIIISAFGMTICMCVSGTYTMWIKQGTSTLTWIPLACLGMYVVTSMLGLLSIPWTMTAELFPIEIRGVAHSICISLANLLMFASIQLYYPLNDLMGGAAGLQYFFACISIIGSMYAYVFLPETHNTKLTDIQTYFSKNTMYICQSKNKKQKKPILRPKSKNIVRNGNAQSENLLKA